MFCHSCGAKLVENAKFCTSCGTKAHIQESFESVAVTSSVVVKPPDPVATFNLFGTPITLPSVTEEYVTIRSQFFKRAVEARNHLQHKMDSNYHNLDDLIADGDSVADFFITSALETGLSILQSRGIYNLDLKGFAKRSTKYLGYWDYHFSGVREKFHEIINYKDEQREWREIRKESRGKLVGGGFGVDGAIKGMAMAGTANLASGMLHSFANAIGNVFTAAETSSLKNKVFNDDDTRRAIVNALFLDVFSIHKATIDCLDHASLKEASDFYSSTNEQEAYVIYRNIQDGKVPERDLTAQINEILRKDPFNMDYYELAIRRNWDHDIGELVRYAQFFHMFVPVEGIINRITLEKEEQAQVQQLFGEHTHAIETALQRNSLYLENIADIIEGPTDALKRIFFSIQRGTMQSSLLLLPADQSERAAAKLQKARSNFASYSLDETPILLFDDSITGSVKSGFLVTNRGVYAKSMMENPWFCSFEELLGVKHTGGITLLDSKSVLGRKTIDITQVSGIDKYDFYDFVEIILILLKYNGDVIASLWQNPTGQQAEKVNKDTIIPEIRDLVINLDNKQVRLSLFAIDESEKVNKRFQGALSTYAKLENDEKPIVIFDPTMFGNGKTGCLISDQNIYIQNAFEKPIKISISAIMTMSLKGNDLRFNQHSLSLGGIAFEKNKEAFKTCIEEIISLLNE